MITDIAGICRIFDEISDYSIVTMNAFDTSLMRIEFIHNSLGLPKPDRYIPRLILITVDTQWDKIDFTFQGDFPAVVKAECTRLAIEGIYCPHLVRFHLQDGEIMIRCRELAISKTYIEC